LIGWLLDTNVLSESRRPQPEARVVNWLGAAPRDRCFISILTLAEFDKGIETLPAGDPRRPSLQAFVSRVEAAFAGRILTLDDDAVRTWGRLSGRYRRDFGGQAPVVDAMIAAQARKHRLIVASRNSRDFTTLECQTFNPWTDDPANFPIQL
jgi:hypothetical protein